MRSRSLVGLLLAAVFLLSPTTAVAAIETVKAAKRAEASGYFEWCSTYTGAEYEGGNRPQEIDSYVFSVLFDRCSEEANGEVTPTQKKLLEPAEKTVTELKIADTELKSLNTELKLAVASLGVIEKSVHEVVAGKPARTVLTELETLNTTESEVWSLLHESAGTAGTVSFSSPAQKQIDEDFGVIEGVLWFMLGCGLGGFVFFLFANEVRSW